MSTGTSTTSANDRCLSAPRVKVVGPSATERRSCNQAKKKSFRIHREVNLVPIRMRMLRRVRRLSFPTDQSALRKLTKSSF